MQKRSLFISLITFHAVLFLDIIRLRDIAFGRFRVTRDYEIWKSMSKLIPVVLRSISCEQTHRWFFTKIKCHVKWVHGTSPTCFLIKNGWYYSNGAAAASYMILPSTVLISLVYRMFRSAMLLFGKRGLYVSIIPFLHATVVI